MATFNFKANTLNQILIYRLSQDHYHLFIQAISIAPLQVCCYSEVLVTQHGYCVGVSHWSATGNRKWRTHSDIDISQCSVQVKSWSKSQSNGKARFKH